MYIGLQRATAGVVKRGCRRPACLFDVRLLTPAFGWSSGFKEEQYPARKVNSDLGHLRVSVGFGEHEGDINQFRLHLCWFRQLVAAFGQSWVGLAQHRVALDQFAMHLMESAFGCFRPNLAWIPPNLLWPVSASLELASSFFSCCCQKTGRGQPLVLQAETLAMKRFRPTSSDFRSRIAPGICRVVRK